MFTQPQTSLWGQIDHCEVLCPGVFLVSTPSHGGIMVAKGIEEVLSPAARRCGQRKGGFLCFEEDTAEAVVLRELLDKRLWDIPDRIKDKPAFEESINNTLREYHPEYWRSRMRGRENVPPAKDAAKTAPVHENR